MAAGLLHHGVNGGFAFQKQHFVGNRRLGVVGFPTAAKIGPSLPLCGSCRTSSRSRLNACARRLSLAMVSGLGASNSPGSTSWLVSTSSNAAALRLHPSVFFGQPIRRFGGFEAFGQRREAPA